MTMIKMYDAKEKQPENEEVVLVRLDTEIFRFAHYDDRTGKWYGHDTSSPAHEGIPCMAEVVSWTYLPE